MLTSPEDAVSRNPSLGGTIVRKSWSFVRSEFSIVESVDSTTSVADKCVLYPCDEECPEMEIVAKAETTEMIAIAHIVHTATEIEAAIFLCFIVVGLNSEVYDLFLVRSSLQQTAILPKWKLTGDDEQEIRCHQSIVAAIDYE